MEDLPPVDMSTVKTIPIDGMLMIIVVKYKIIIIIAGHSVWPSSNWSPQVCAGIINTYDLLCLITY
jgi:hypothetical protein